MAPIVGSRPDPKSSPLPPPHRTQAGPDGPGANGERRTADTPPGMRRELAPLLPGGEPIESLLRKAQFFLDFAEAENSTGFHAPQEGARILGASIDFARQGQLAVRERAGAAAGRR